MDKQKEQIEKDIIGIMSNINSSEHLIRTLEYELSALKKVLQIDYTKDLAQKIETKQNLLGLLKGRLEEDRANLNFNEEILRDILNEE